MLRIDSKKCNGCGTCIEYCPNGAISLIDGKAVINQKDCMECGICLDVVSGGCYTPGCTGATNGWIFSRIGSWSRRKGGEQNAIWRWNWT